MDHQQYQDEVLRTYVGSDEAREKLDLGALGLAGEAGEVVDAVKKVLYSGHELDTAHLAQELGDVLWYLVLLGDAIGYTLEDIISLNVEKLHKRYPNGFDTERSVHRDQYE